MAYTNPFGPPMTGAAPIPPSTYPFGGVPLPPLLRIVNLAHVECWLAERSRMIEAMHTRRHLVQTAIDEMHSRRVLVFRYEGIRVLYERKGIILRWRYASL